MIPAYFLSASSALRRPLFKWSFRASRTTRPLDLFVRRASRSSASATSSSRRTVNVLLIFRFCNTLMSDTWQRFLVFLRVFASLVVFAMPSLRLLVSRPVQGSPRPRARVFSSLHHDLAIDEYVLNAGGVLVRFLKSRVVGHAFGIEHGNVGEEAGAEQSAVGDAEPLRGRVRHFANRLFERNCLLLAHVTSEDAREGAVFTRMRHALPEM